MSNKKEFMPLLAYVNGNKTKVGYAYVTDNGNLCIRGDKMVDATKLGRMMTGKGCYVELPKDKK